MGDHLRAFLRDINLNVVAFPVSLLLPIFILYLIFKYLRHDHPKSLSKKHLRLPPGPRPWPIIGNIHQVGLKPHVTAAKLAHIYGPLISLRLGTQLVVFASSREAAMDILKTHDRELSSRFVPNAFNIPHSFIWADCDEGWKQLRTLCRTEMFSAKAIESQSAMTEERLRRMIDFLRSKEGEVVNIEEVVFTTTFNTLSNMLFTRDFLDLDEENGTASGLRGKLFTILKYAVTPNIGDFYPMLGWLDLQGLRRGSVKHATEFFGVWGDIIKERRDRAVLDSSVQNQDFLDRLLENGFPDDRINRSALELFIAGTDTTTSTIEWAMAELLRNEDAMSKAQQEIRRELKSSSITELQISNLPYLHACIKETLRLHPPVPFLLPHRALETCEVMNCTIPQGAQILVNIWAIGRDPAIWEDPLSFKPERFLESNIDYKGQDFEFIPFGAGRRMCPGLPVGMKQVQLILASLIHEFDWFLPNGEDPSKLDMTDKFGVTLQKEKPLQLIFKQR